MAIIWRFVGRSTALATCLLLLLLGMELHSSMVLNTWTPPVFSALIVAYLLYFIHAQANSNRTLRINLGSWNAELRHKLVNELTVVLGSLELMDPTEKHRLNAMAAARNARNTLLSDSLENRGKVN